MTTKGRSIDLVTGARPGAATPATPAAPPAAERRQDGVLTPREVLRRARANVEHIGACTVVGELSEVRPHRNGHLMFKLLDGRDRKAALPCVIWFNDTKRLQFDLVDGLEVQVEGKLSLNDFASVQLVVKSVAPVGQGALELKFQQMRQKLDAEGFFAVERKRPLPFLPRAVGIVTSAQGAALRDVLARLQERFPRVHVVVAPTKVQGDGAAAEIAAAIRLLDQSGRVDVLLVVRGGGSREDLWAFNTEPVARAIFGARVPVIAGVGHETDTTIADLVADVRAATPTHAAELAVPRLDELLARLEVSERRLRGRMQHALDERRGRATALARRLDHAFTRRRRTDVDRLRALAARLATRSPERVVRELRARLAQLEGRLTPAAHAVVHDRAHRLQLLGDRLTPAMHAAMRGRAARLQSVVDRLTPAVRGVVRERHQRLALLAARLEMLSPLGVVARGYAIATRADDGRVVHVVADAPAGSVVDVKVKDGTLRTRVLEGKAPTDIGSAD